MSGLSIKLEFNCGHIAKKKKGSSFSCLFSFIKKKSPTDQH